MEKMYILNCAKCNFKVFRANYCKTCIYFDECKTAAINNSKVRTN